MAKCLKCEKEFQPSKFAPKKKYCSDHCQRSSYMSTYNKEGARRRAALEREECPACGTKTRQWFRNPEYNRVCMKCDNKFKMNTPIASPIYSETGARYYGRDWWINRQIGKFTVLDIPFEPLCNGRSTDTKVKVRCNRGHEFEKEVCNIGSNCRLCVEESERKQEAFKKMEIPDIASMEDWSELISSNTDLQLVSSPETYWSKGQDLKVVMKCWCGREWSPRWNDVTSKRIVSCGCVNRASKPVELIEQYIKDKGFTVEREKPVDEFQADMFVVEKNLVIEFDGLRWHKNINDFRKYNTYKKYMYNFLGVYEDEWENDRNKIFGIINDALGLIVPVERQNLHFTMESDDNRFSYRLQDNNGVVVSIDVDLCGKILSFKRSYTNDIELFTKLWEEVRSVNKGPFVVELDNRKNDRYLFGSIGFMLSASLPPKAYWVKERMRELDSGQDKGEMKEKGWYLLNDCGWTEHKYE